MAVAAQAIAVAAGWYLGFAWLKPVGWVADSYLSYFYLLCFLSMKILAVVACFIFAVEGRHCLLSTASNRARLMAAEISIALAVYTACLMINEPFIDYYGDIGCYMDVLLLLPLLVGINFLVRGRVWAGTGAAVVFIAISLEMIIHNACARGGANGFFRSIVY